MERVLSLRRVSSAPRPVGARMPAAWAIAREHLIGCYNTFVTTPGPYRLTSLRLTAEGSYTVQATNAQGKPWHFVTGSWSFYGNVLKASHFVPDLGVVAFEVELGSKTRSDLTRGLTVTAQVGPQGRATIRLTRTGTV